MCRTVAPAPRSWLVFQPAPGPWSRIGAAGDLGETGFMNSSAAGPVVAVTEQLPTDGTGWPSSPSGLFAELLKHDH